MAYELSERRACRAFGVARSSIRYRSVRPRQEALRRRIRDLAGIRVRSGYRQIYVLLRREGWAVNHKRVYRLYTEEGLTLKRRKPKRRKAAANRKAPALPAVPNERWAMDFIHDTLAGGTTLRILSVLDLCTRECLVLAADRSFRGEQVARVLGDLGQKRGLPARITVDNGTEFTSKALDHWAYWNRMELDFTRPGRPVDNAHVEAFHGTLRRECLSQHWFLDLEDARRTLEGGLQQPPAPQQLGADASRRLRGRRRLHRGPNRAPKFAVGELAGAVAGLGGVARDSRVRTWLMDASPCRAKSRKRPECSSSSPGRYSERSETARGEARDEC